LVVNLAGNRHRCQLRQEMCADEKRVGVMGKGEARFLYRTIFSANKRDFYFLGRGEGVGIYTQKRGCLPEYTQRGCT
jgi:hypothetical protein